MNVPDEVDTILRKYLLEEMSPEEKGNVDEQLFLDSDFFEQLQMAEDELVDDYVNDELSPDERARFDSHFLSLPERHESLRIALAIKKYPDPIRIPEPHPVPTLEPDGPAKKPKPISSLLLGLFPFLRFRNPVLRFSMLAAQLVIIIGGLWLIIKVFRPRSSDPEPATVQSTQKSEELPVTSPDNRPKEEQTNNRERTETEPGHGPTPSRTVKPLGDSVHIALITPVATVRGGEQGQKIELPPNTSSVELQLPLIDGTTFRRYRATMRLSDNGAVRMWDNLRPSTGKGARVVSFRVSSELLHPQKYQVTLSGIASNGTSLDIRTYSFQVVK